MLETVVLETWTWIRQHGMLRCVPVAPSPVADQMLAAVLMRLRKERGVTQEKLALNAGLTTRSYQKIEHGHSSPEWVTVRRIVKALDLKLVEFALAIEGEETESQKIHQAQEATQ